LGGKDHQQAFAGALEVPDEPFFALSAEHALDDAVGAFVLLVAADDFQAAFFLVGGKEGKVRQDVEQDVGAEERGDGLG
jgi:hypothetical protein